MIPALWKLLQSIETDEKLLKSFYKGNVALLCKTDKVRKKKILDINFTYKYRHKIPNEILAICAQLSLKRKNRQRVSVVYFFSSVRATQY